MPKIDEVLARADKSCTHGSTNYKQYRAIYSAFHQLLTYAQSPSADLDTLAARTASNLMAVHDKKNPYDLKEIFTAIETQPFSLFLAKSIPKYDIAQIETIIAEIYVSLTSEDEWLKREYVERLKDFDKKTVPSLFYGDTYLNGIRSLMYGFGNCALRADALLVELIRAGTSDQLHLTMR